MSLSLRSATVERDGATYRVRPFAPGDEAGVRAVYESVTGYDPGPAWFDATYGADALLETPAVVVVEYEGSLVGILPSVPYRVRVGDSETVGLLGRDVMVLPEHRRRGVFSAATELALEQCNDHEAVSFVFGHSNAASRAACERMGWTYPSMQPAFVRPRRVGAFVRARTDSVRSPRYAATTALLAGQQSARDAFRGLSSRLGRRSETFAVRRVEGVPAGVVARLHDAGRPDAPHPVFDEATVRRHFVDPEFATSRTYVASRDGVDEAAVVVSERRWHRTRWHSVVHVAPLSADDGRRRALRSLLERLLADGEDADAFRVAVPFPTDLLRSFGFLSDRGLPMSALEPPRLSLGYHAVRDDEIGAALDADSHHLWHLSA